MLEIEEVTTAYVYIKVFVYLSYLFVYVYVAGEIKIQENLKFS
jgi:hypothetical protein